MAAHAPSISAVIQDFTAYKTRRESNVLDYSGIFGRFGQFLPGAFTQKEKIDVVNKVIDALQGKFSASLTDREMNILTSDTLGEVYKSHSRFIDDAFHMLKAVSQQSIVEDEKQDVYQACLYVFESENEYNRSTLDSKYQSLINNKNKRNVVLLLKDHGISYGQHEPSDQKLALLAALADLQYKSKDTVQSILEMSDDNIKLITKCLEFLKKENIDLNEQGIYAKMIANPEIAENMQILLGAEIPFKKPYLKFYKKVIEDSNKAKRLIKNIQLLKGSGLPVTPDFFPIYNILVKSKILYKCKEKEKTAIIKAVQDLWEAHIPTDEEYLECYEQVIDTPSLAENFIVLWHARISRRNDPFKLYELADNAASNLENIQILKDANIPFERPYDELYHNVVTYYYHQSRGKSKAEAIAILWKGGIQDMDYYAAITDDPSITPEKIQPLAEWVVILYQSNNGNKHKTLELYRKIIRRPEIVEKLVEVYNKREVYTNLYQVISDHPDTVELKTIIEAFVFDDASIDLNPLASCVPKINEKYSEILQKNEPMIVAIFETLMKYGYSFVQYRFIYNALLEQSASIYSMQMLFAALIDYAKSHRHLDENEIKILLETADPVETLQSGPLNKTAVTYAVEALLERLIQDPLNIDIVLDEYGDYIITIDGEVTNLSILLRNANLTHLTLSDEKINQLSFCLAKLIPEIWEPRRNAIFMNKWGLDELNFKPNEKDSEETRKAKEKARENAQKVAENLEKVFAIYYNNAGYFKSINKIFRQEPLGEAKYVLSESPIENLLACFLCGILLITIANELYGRNNPTNGLEPFLNELINFPLKQEEIRVLPSTNDQSAPVGYFDAAGDFLLTREENETAINVSQLLEQAYLNNIKLDGQQIKKLIIFLEKIIPGIFEKNGDIAFIENFDPTLIEQSQKAMQLLIKIFNVKGDFSGKGSADYFRLLGESVRTHGLSQITLELSSEPDKNFLAKLLLICILSGIANLNKGQETIIRFFDLTERQKKTYVAHQDDVMAFSALASFSTNPQGSHYFRSKNQRIVIENPPHFNARIDPNPEEGEIFIPPHETVMPTKSHDGTFVCRIVRSPSFAERERYESDLALRYVFEKFSLKKYEDASNSHRLINGQNVQRPNHNVTHYKRKMEMVHGVVNYFAHYACDDEFKYYCQNITPAEMEWLRIALAFSVTGRESECSFAEASDAYLRYKAASRDNFIDYLQNMRPELAQNDFMKNNLAEVIGNMGNPNYETLLNKKHDSKEITIEEFRARSFYHRVLNMAHDLDLVRCYRPKEYHAALQQSSGKFSENSWLQQKALNALIRYDIELIKAHGGTLTCDMNENDELISVSERYKDHYAETSLSLIALSEMTATVPRPDWLKYTIASQLAGSKQAFFGKATRAPTKPEAIIIPSSTLLNIV